MARQHIVPITNGKGSKELANLAYTITSSTLGYDDTTITPAEQEVSEGVDNYDFTIAATGTLTIHVSDDGTDIGIPIVGATFSRCDAEGTTYGDPITSTEEGNVIFTAVPFSADEKAPVIYFKQTSSDGEHTYNAELQNTTLAEETKIIELANEAAVTRNFNFTDATYSGLPIADGQVILNEPEV